MASYTAAFGHITYNDEVYDEAVALVMRAPHTYTTEDVVEFDCHGGITVLKRILDLVISLGARPAEGGEFTKRAFLGGRIDMSQAEAVMDLINSKNELAAKASLKKLQGGLKDIIADMREKLLYNIAYIESALDDPENYSLDEFPQELKSVVENLLITIDKLIKNGYLNDTYFAKCYINDKVNLTNDGPLKIIKYLEDNNIEREVYSEIIDKEDEIWSSRIKKYLEKQVKLNKKSSYYFKNKMMVNLINLGYEKEMINSCLNNITIDNQEELKNIEKEKIRKKLEKKYSGKELERKIKEKLYQRGFFE